jgi:hypothetical protein
MRNKITSSVLLLWHKMRSEKIEFPLENIKRIALRPSEAKGETFYSLPIVESLQKKYKLTVLLPEDQDAKFFRRLRVKIIRYPGKLGLIGIYRLKKKINQSFDLLIDLNRENSHVFSYLLKNPIVASIFEAPGVNITAKAETKSITNSYQYLISLLGFPTIKWKTKTIRTKRSRKKKKNEEIIGISSDISTPYHGIQRVSNEDDLRKISKLITKKNDLSTIAFFLELPQVLLLEEKDPFQPPESIKVVRYSRKISQKIIGDCLVM